MTFVRFTSLAVLAVGLTNVAPSVAAPPVAAPPVPTVERLFQEGRALLANGHPAEACERFEASLQLEPDAAGVLLNLGLCNEQLGRLATALRWFRKAQARASETALPDHERAAKQHAAVLASKVPTIAVVFSSPPPPETTVTVDGIVVLTSEIRRIEVDPGEHVVEARTLGRPAISSTFQIAAGEARTVPLGFEARRRDAPRAAYFLMGGGTALLAAGTVVGLIGMRGADGNSRTTAEGWNTFADYGLTPIYAGGLACLGVGIALYLRAPLVAVVDANRVSVAVAARF